jgi:hypothetical protein
LRAEIDAVSFGNARPNLAHELLDVELVSRWSLRLLRRRTTVGTAAVGTAPAAVIVGSARALRVVVRHRPSAMLHRGCSARRTGMKAEAGRRAMPTRPYDWTLADG